MACRILTSLPPGRVVLLDREWWWRGRSCHTVKRGAEVSQKTRTLVGNEVGRGYGTLKPVDHTSPAPDKHVHGGIPGDWMVIWSIKNLVVEFFVND